MKPLARFSALCLTALFAAFIAHSQTNECGIVVDPDDPTYSIDLSQLGGIHNYNNTPICSSGSHELVEDQIGVISLSYKCKHDVILT